VKASAALTAGHSYTLTLLDHDDNYAGDPTYTLYDDVAISTGWPFTKTAPAAGSGFFCARGASGYPARMRLAAFEVAP
jgi:hypothetical protein